MLFAFDNPCAPTMKLSIVASLALSLSHGASASEEKDTSKLFVHVSGCGVSCGTRSLWGRPVSSDTRRTLFGQPKIIPNTDLPKDYRNKKHINFHRISTRKRRKVVQSRSSVSFSRYPPVFYPGCDAFVVSSLSTTHSHHLVPCADPSFALQARRIRPQTGFVRYPTLRRVHCPECVLRQLHTL